MAHTQFKFLAIILCLAACPKACNAAQQGNSMDQRFEALGNRYMDEFTRFSPVSATLLGDHRYDGQLDQVGNEAQAEKGRFFRQFLSELQTVKPAELSRANQVDYALLDHDLRADLWRQEVLQEWAWNPLAYTGLSGNAIYSLMARDFAPLEERLSCAASRLEQFPRLFTQIRATLQPARVPKIHAETAVDQNRGVLSILNNMVEPHLDRLPAVERERLVKALAAAREAVNTHQKWLESELLPNAAGNFRLGRELYDQKLAFALQTSMTRQQVRTLADRQLHELRERMYAIARDVYRQRYPHTEFPSDPSDAYKQAIIRACLELACAELPDPNRIVDEAKLALERITAFVRQKDIVTIPPDPLDIIVMPEFQRGVSLAYCDSPGVLDVGQKTFYAVAPPPKDWTQQQVRSLLREYNTRSLYNLTIHEAMPGHFLQLAHSNRYPGKLRTLLGSGTFVEGWAVYTEWMMVEEGFCEGDPLMQLVVLKWYLRDVTNAILDQAVHVDGISEDQALKLLIEDAFQEEREAAGKWKRACLTSAQLSTYFVGYLEHVQLRRQVEESWGDSFSLKSYHDKVLSFGSPPVKFVRALMLDQPIPLP
ncbi:MAG TPA: DUF885 domain-containing protein [Sedimentisphaerales bacterium]|nr:DUF885 domain-containing protein [Sedimentisphaerales bacterium]